MKTGVEPITKDYRLSEKYSHASLVTDGELQFGLDVLSELENILDEVSNDRAQSKLIELRFQLEIERDIRVGKGEYKPLGVVI